MSRMSRMSPMGSIRVKLFVLTCAVLLVVVAITTAYFAQRHVSGLQGALIAKAEVYARMTSRQAVAALAFDDVVTAREAFEAAAVDPDVVLITLRRADGTVLYEHGRDDARMQTGRLIKTRAPIISPEGPAGALELAVSDARVSAASRDALIASLIAGLLSLLVGCGATWLVGSQFGRRIARVTTHARAVAENEIGCPPLLDRSRDEIGVLARAFDTMTSSLDERVRRRTQELATAVSALKESEDFTRAIVENAADGILTVSAPTDGAAARVLTWNAAAERIFGVPASEAIGRPVGDFLKRSNRVGRGEESITRADGSTTPVSVNFTEVRRSAASGEQVAVRVGIVRDLADEKRGARQLAEMNTKLVDASRLAGMADVASGILHNVGNVLNSVNVSVTLLDDTVRRSNADGVVKIAALLKSKSEAAGGLGAFFTNDEKAKKVPDFMDGLAKQLSGERTKLGDEIGALRKNVDHIREIVAMQQAYTSKSGVCETLQLLDVVNDAAELSIDSKGPGEIEVIRDFDDVPLLMIDRHRTMQILVNLLRNARHAVRDSHRDDPRITIRVRNQGDRLAICVEDNGVGVATKNFGRLFEQGFTTKKDGHGYGLHSSANVARELGGSLTAHSDGAGRGATFTLDLPLTPVAEQPHLGEEQSHRKEAA